MKETSPFMPGWPVPVDLFVGRTPQIEEIIRYVIPYRYRLTKEQLVRFSESRDLQEFRSVLATTWYADIFRDKADSLWETISLNFIHGIHKKRLRMEFFSLGSTMAYLHLQEADIKNIITLIEGIRYSLPREEIRSYLIGME